VNVTDKPAPAVYLPPQVINPLANTSAPPIALALAVAPQVNAAHPAQQQQLATGRPQQATRAGQHTASKQSLSGVAETGKVDAYL
jgi:hypothetical protein